MSWPNCRMPLIECVLIQSNQLRSPVQVIQLHVLQLLKLCQFYSSVSWNIMYRNGVSICTIACKPENALKTKVFSIFHICFSDHNFFCHESFRNKCVPHSRIPATLQMIDLSCQRVMPRPFSTPPGRKLDFWKKIWIIYESLHRIWKVIHQLHCHLSMLPLGHLDRVCPTPLVWLGLARILIR